MIRLSAEDLAQERPSGVAEDVHFPQTLVRAVIEEFTSAGDVVLDPFAGYGTTLLVSEDMGRHGVGIELLPERAELIRRRLGDRGRVLTGDARELVEPGLGPVDLCLTSPPYMNAVDHPENPLTGYRSLDGDYRTYLAELEKVFISVSHLLKPEGHLVVSAANITTGGVVTPLAWDISRILAEHLTFRGETYVWWDRPPPWLSGDYCLVFQRL